MIKSKKNIFLKFFAILVAFEFLFYIPLSTLKAVSFETEFGECIMPVDGPITLVFGEIGYGGPHEGIDIAAEEGTPVHAAHGGTVIFVGRDAHYGNYVIIEHVGGYSTLYAHMREIDVVLGQRVNQGFNIGQVGSTGAATGPHLHFEIRRDVNGTITIVDPRAYLHIDRN